MRHITTALALVLASSVSAATLDVTHVRFDPPAPTTDGSVFVDVSGRASSSCGPPFHRVDLSGTVVTLTFRRYPPFVVCLPQAGQWVKRVHLGRLGAGVYEVIVATEEGDQKRESLRLPLVVRDASIAVTPFALAKNQPGQRVLLSLRDETPVALVNEVIIDGISVMLRSSAIASDVLIEAPSHGPGTVDVTMVFADGTRHTAIAALTYYDPAAEVDRRIFEPILFPLAFEGHGAVGTRWTTENDFLASSVVWREPRPSIKASSAPLGVLLWAVRGTAATLFASSRIRETTRGGLGTDIPVVREKDFRRHGIALINIAQGPHTRTTLRIYALGDEPEYVDVGVRPILLTPVGNGLLFAAVDLTSIRPTSVYIYADPYLEFWAMASTTDSETQHVTVNWPR